jgi:predicted permease
MVRRQPGFLAAVVVTLGLGMGAATAMFTVLDALVVNPLPFDDPDRLVMIADEGGIVATPLLEQLQAETRIFEAVVGHFPKSRRLTEPGEPRNLRLEAVGPGFLSMLGIAPQIGRMFGEDEAVPGRDRVILIGDELWRSAFDADPGVLGRTIRLSGELYTVIGVLPPALRRMPNGQVRGVVPLVAAPDQPGVLALGRLREGVTLEAAQARLDEIGALLDREQPRSSEWRPVAQELGTRAVRRERPAIIALSGAAAFLLLVACANAAGLLFVRGVARESEFAVRRALGASRRSLFRQLLTESLVMALLAGGLGTLIAFQAVRGMLSIAPESITVWHFNTVRVDGTAYVFAFALTILTGLFFGIVPAVWASRRSEAVRASDRTMTAGRSRVRTRRVVQVVQLALAVLLLSSAGLLGRSFIRLSAVDPGFDAERLVMLTVPAGSGRNAEERAQFNRRLDEELRSLPGVTAVGWADGTAIHFTQGLQAEGSEAGGDGPLRIIISSSVDTAYVGAMGIALTEGRRFDRTDLAESVNPVIIDSDLARLLWPAGSAIGRRFRIDDGQPWYSVVGVVDDAKLEGLDDRENPWVIFHPTTVERIGFAAIGIRIAGDPGALLPAVREVVRSLDPEMPVTDLMTGRRALAETIAEPRFVLVVMSVFAGVAVVLAALGVYGLFAFSVAQRRREIGVRMAIGAHGGRVVRQLFREGFLLAGAGLAIGLASAASLSGFVESLLFEVSPNDAVTYALVCGLLLAACCAAILGPARRAARIDPASTLRAD